MNIFISEETACIYVMVRDKSSTNSPDYSQLSENTRKRIEEKRLVYQEQLVIQKEHENFLKKNIVLFSDARRLRLK